MSDATDKICDSIDKLAQPTGPTYAQGQGRVIYAGWLPEGHWGVAGFRAIVEFPHGPPDWPWSVIWEGTPVTLTCARSAGAEVDREAPSTHG